MTEYNHLYNENNTRNQESSSTYQPVSGTSTVRIAAADLAANTKYLIIARAVFIAGNATDHVKVRLQTNDDSNIAVKSETIVETNLSLASDEYKSWLFVHSYTTDGGPADLILQTASSTAGGESNVDQMSLMVIDLDDIGTEGTDYFEDINAATGNEVAVDPSFTTLASIGGLVSGDEYVILGQAKIGVGSQGRYMTVETRSGTTVINSATEEGEDNAELRMFGAAGIKASGDTTANIRATEEAANGNMTDEGSYLIAIPVAAFADVASDFTAGSVTSTNETTVASVGPYTPSLDGNHLIIGLAGKTPASGALQKIFLEDGTTETRTGDSDPTHDQVWDTGKDQEAKYTMERISISAQKTYNLRVDSLGTTASSNLRNLLVINLNKPATGALFGIGSAASDGDAVLSVFEANVIPFDGPQNAGRQYRMGPFYDEANARQYGLFGVDNGSTWSQLKMVAADDADDLWKHVVDGSSGRTISLFVARHFIAERKIVVAYNDASSNLFYSQFDLATETWEVDHQVVATDGSTSTQTKSFDIALRNDGEVHLAYDSNDANNISRLAIRANLTPATTWTSGVIAEDFGGGGGTPHNENVVAGLGDRMHIVVRRGAQTQTEEITYKADDTFVPANFVGDGGHTINYGMVSSAVSFEHGSDVVVYYNVYDLADEPDADPIFEWFLSADAVVDTATEAIPTGWAAKVPLPDTQAENGLTFIRHLGGYLVHIAIEDATRDAVYQFLRQGEYEGGTYTALAGVAATTVPNASSHVNAELFIRGGDVYVGMLYRNSADINDDWTFVEQLVGAVLIPLVGSGAAASDGDSVLTTIAGPVPLNGIGSAASAGDAILSKVQTLEGIGSASSAGTSVLTKTQALTGVGSAASDGDSVLSITVELLGLGSASSAGDGVLSKTQALLGIGSASSAGDSVLSAKQALVGTGAASADGVGVLTKTQALSGIGSAASDGDSVITIGAAIIPLAGIGSAASDGDSVLTIFDRLLGSGGAASAGDAVLSSVQALSGVGAASSDGSGVLTATQALLGVGSAASDGDSVLSTAGVVTLLGVGSAASAGDSTIQSVQSMTAVGAAASDGTGVLTSKQTLVGSGAAASDGDGLLTKFQALAGIGSASSAGDASMSNLQALEGIGSAASDGDAVLSIEGATVLFGIGSASSAGDATLTSTQALQGSGAAASSGDSIISIGGLVAMIGSGAAASDGLGVLSKEQALQGLGANASDGTAVLTVFDRMVGAGGAASAGDAVLSGTIALFGTGSASSTGTSTLSSIQFLIAVGGAASAGDAVLTKTQMLIGVGAAASDGDASLGIKATTFWIEDPIAFSKSPVAFDPVKKGDVTPW